MGKRKGSISSDGEVEDASSDSAPIRSELSKKKTSARTIKKPKLGAYKNATVSSSQQQDVKDIPEANTGEIKVLINAEGDRYIDLGKMKRAVVRSFKGVPLLDIREYYGQPGEEKPGKKGISLTLDQWQLLNGGSTAIDELFAQQKHKKNT